MKTHRLQELAKALSLSIGQLEREIGAGISTLNKAIKRDTPISKGIASMIVDRFPQVNKDWLLTGQGEMFNKPSMHPKPGIISEPEESYKAYKQGLEGELLYKAIQEIADIKARLKRLEEGKN